MATSHVQSFVQFLTASPTPFHAVENAATRLRAAGFRQLREKQSWGELQAGASYFWTRNGTSIVAFVVGGRYQRGNGFAIVGAHTDSPCLKIKPCSKRTKLGYQQVGVETYGGGIWHSWFDRDLALAGRVMVQQKSQTSGHTKLEARLINIDRPILRIPTLAIHLDRSVNDTFKFNNEIQLTPILGLTSSSTSCSGSAAGTTDHHEALLQAVAEAAACRVDAIVDFELSLYDAQAPCVGGLQREFVHSARLDNLTMSYCALEALLAAEHVADDPMVRVMVLFDNEEIGSVSAHGAASNLLVTAIQRVLAVDVASPKSLSQTDTQAPALARSLLISADMAHAVHPNYADRHEDEHRPQLNGGVVVKQNANQRYATTSVTRAVLRRVADAAGVPLQDFVVRNDSPCGSTIGPMLSAKLGLRTIDVGNPQLSMHSIRETCGAADVDLAIRLFTTFYEQWHRIEAELDDAL
ncbi:hypothetical protein CXG81DRAFT_13910 [Caulochytrium protostelioides]|uniref:aspartyl aminopeptidase n=1 Tax=Caulochytrium protostelioides TaxID=1555241 RepID=A0A4P9X499_9FUNG|nr:hypothetical protein CXG81DRAFT_13910 [Caulochytrium protostelioides]|eukprot:RKO99883.1 hypothetical protein CXG81DRAFT_13910 [Caulochytrium protostelioides]